MSRSSPDAAAAAGAAAGAQAKASADPFTIAVIQAGFEAAAAKMFDTLRKTAMSPIIYEVLDLERFPTQMNRASLRRPRQRFESAVFSKDWDLSQNAFGRCGDSIWSKSALGTVVLDADGALAFLLAAKLGDPA